MWLFLDATEFLVVDVKISLHFSLKKSRYLWWKLELVAASTELTVLLAYLDRARCYILWPRSHFPDRTGPRWQERCILSISPESLLRTTRCNFPSLSTDPICRQLYKELYWKVSSKVFVNSLTWASVVDINCNTTSGCRHLPSRGPLVLGPWTVTVDPVNITSITILPTF